MRHPHHTDSGGECHEPGGHREGRELCSPDARLSQLVDDEIARFAETNRVEQIVPILVSGLPNNEARDKPTSCADGGEGPFTEDPRFA